VTEEWIPAGMTGYQLVIWSVRSYQSQMSPFNNLQLPSYQRLTFESDCLKHDTDKNKTSILPKNHLEDEVEVDGKTWACLSFLALQDLTSIFNDFCRNPIESI
jgi:hypothetical protein